VASISARHSGGIGRSGWRCRRDSKSSGFIKSLAVKRRSRHKMDFAISTGLSGFVTFVHFGGYFISS
jgi:hypothetical protein